MEADLMNLRPAIGELNADRSDNPFGIIESEPRQYGACNFEVQGGVVEPDEPDRGKIGRTYLYMESVWGMALTADERALYTQWHAGDPPDAFEIEKNRRISELQGVGNSFVTNPQTGTCTPRTDCCRVCVTSQACGDSCIDASRNCSKGDGPGA
jgi:deoxyribonuclease-1